jgi:glycerophosphoryl diester phosphodiesterase
VSTDRKGLWTFPGVLAHRGGGALAPENTLAGLRLAARLGYAGAEFDVKLTAEGVPVLMHDDSLDRTTSGHGPVAAASFPEVATLDAGGWFNHAFAGERVPTYEAAAGLCRTLGLWANVEIKPCPGREAETGHAVARESMRLWAGDAKPPLLSSYSVEALAAAQATAPLLPRGLLVEDPPDDWRSALAGLGCVALHVEHGRATPELAAAVHAAGYGLLCYTANDPARAALLYSFGVDCIVTDRLDLFDPLRPIDLKA